MRWRALFFLNPNIRTETRETYGFKTNTRPPTIAGMKDFETKLTDLIRNIDYSQRLVPFQRKLINDVKAIKREPKIMVFSDKTDNIYKLDKHSYTELLKKNVTKDYKKTSQRTKKNIIAQDIAIATELEISDRIDVQAEKNSVIRIKDHKEDFSHDNPSCRLINPYKSNIGQISKQILDRTNQKLLSILSVNQWQNTASVLEWFRSFNPDKKHKFISFDVVNFYPSITRNLLLAALQFASSHDDRLTQTEIDIILHTKNTILFHDGEPWRKDNGPDIFDVTMGSFDGAETCNLVGIYLLAALSPICSTIGLYRDDGLCISNKTARETDILKKKICKTFKDHGLKITISANLKVVNFLDVTLDLNTYTFKPYIKPNSSLKYVHRHSNHPPTILKNIPQAINDRLSKISSNEHLFNQSAPTFQTALQKSGYNHTLKFNAHPQTSTRNNRRQRKITWYNPPYCQNVRTNIGRKFLQILDQCFPPTHPLRKIFNRSTVKLSYSCSPSINQIIHAQNHKILEGNTNQPRNQRTCNCISPSNCPLSGQCLTKDIVYQATVTRLDNHTKETYVGITANEFKTRYNNHTASFRNPRRDTETELSKHIWKLKKTNVQHNVEWKILKKCRPYNNIAKRCQLCTYEKYVIVCKGHLATLNKRSELLNTCPHRKKFRLKHYNNG